MIRVSLNGQKNACRNQITKENYQCKKYEIFLASALSFLSLTRTDTKYACQFKLTMPLQAIKKPTMYLKEQHIFITIYGTSNKAKDPGVQQYSNLYKKLDILNFNTKNKWIFKTCYFHISINICAFLLVYYNLLKNDAIILITIIWPTYVNHIVSIISSTSFATFVNAWENLHLCHLRVLLSGKVQKNEKKWRMMYHFFFMFFFALY